MVSDLQIASQQYFLFSFLVPETFSFFLSISSTSVRLRDIYRKKENWIEPLRAETIQQCSQYPISEFLSLLTLNKQIKAFF